MKRIKMPPKAQIKNLSMAILSRLKQKGQGIVSAGNFQPQKRRRF